MQIECNRRTADDLRGLAGQRNMLAAAVVKPHESHTGQSIFVVMSIAIAMVVATRFVTVMMAATARDFAVVAR